MPPPCCLCAAGAHRRLQRSALRSRRRELRLGRASATTIFSAGEAGIAGEELADAARQARRQVVADEGCRRRCWFDQPGVGGLDRRAGLALGRGGECLVEAEHCGGRMEWSKPRRDLLALSACCREDVARHWGSVNGAPVERDGVASAPCFDRRPARALRLADPRPTSAWGSTNRSAGRPRTRGTRRCRCPTARAPRPRWLPEDAGEVRIEAGRPRQQPRGRPATPSSADVPPCSAALQGDRRCRRQLLSPRRVRARRRGEVEYGVAWEEQRRAGDR